MNHKFSRMTSLFLALIFLSSPAVPIHAASSVVTEPVQPNIDNIDEKFVDVDKENTETNENENNPTVQDTKADTKQALDKAALEAEINNYNSDSVSKLANKLSAEEYDLNKVAKNLSEEIKKAHPKSLGKFKELADTVKKEEYPWTTNYEEWIVEIIKLQKETIEQSNDLTPSQKKEGLDKLNKKLTDVLNPGPDADIDLVIESLINKWNGWPSGPLAKAMQIAVIKKYGLNNSSLDQHKDTDLGEYEKHIDTIGMVMEAMKSKTYKELSEKGFTHLTLYRGLRLREELKDKEAYAHRLSGLSSFTMDLNIAKGFGTPFDYNGYVLAKQFPINRILSFWETGLGTHFEYEMVVLGPQFFLDEFYVLKQPTPKYEDPFSQPKKSPKFNKWIDYGHQKAVDKKTLQQWNESKKNKGKKEEASSAEASSEEASSAESTGQATDIVAKKVTKSAGVFAFIFEVFEAIFTFFKDLITQLYDFIISLF